MVEQLHAQAARKYRVLAADCVDSLHTHLKSTPVRAVLAHLAKGTLNGHSVGRLLNEVRQMAAGVAVVGLIEPDLPADVRREAETAIHPSLPLPLDLPDLERLLEQDDLAADPQILGSFAGLPHRTLRGITRSLVTFAPSMFDMFDELKVAAAHEVTVLLIGETGSGKTYLARLIHELSSRRNQRCLTVACGALPPDLIESELFGYVKGAFTGADSDKPGKFAAADRGTLLLDEIDVLAPEQQAKLLRVIETGEYEPVGSNDTRTSNARLIVASNIDLEALVKAEKFRMDLFYRLNTLSFHLPPLRERPWDIEYLARRFAVEHSRAHQIHLKHIEPEFLAALRQYHWPGNIRELENIIRRAVLYCREGVLSSADLPSALRPAGGTRPTSNGDSRRMLTLDERVSQVERRIIEESLQRNNFHRTDTARELGISRVTLYNKMKKLGILN